MKNVSPRDAQKRWSKICSEMSYSLDKPSETQMRPSKHQQTQATERDAEMKLLTKAIEAKLPKLMEQDGYGDDAICFVKFFLPNSGWSWYVTEYDPETQTFFGYVDGQFPELGYFTLQQLQAVRCPLGLRIERDYNWMPRSLGDVKDE